MNCMWDVLFSCILCYIEPYWSWQLTQIVMGVHSTWTCKSCSGLINIFKDTLFTSVRCFQLCLCPACSSSPLPPNLLFVVCPQHFLYFWTHSVFSLCSCQCRNDIYRGTLFRPLQFFCKVRYVNWPVLPFQSSCMCCMCAANRIIHSISNSVLLMKYFCLLTTSQNQTLLGQYGLKDTDITFSTCLQLLQQYIDLYHSENQLITLPLFRSLKSCSCMGTFIIDLYLNVLLWNRIRDWPKIKHCQVDCPLINSSWIDQVVSYESLILAHYCMCISLYRVSSSLCLIVAQHQQGQHCSPLVSVAEHGQ